MTSEISSLFAIALGHHQAGQLAEAERIYRQILARDSRHADSLHLLGMVAYQSGNLDVAGKLIEAAITVRPNEALYYSNLGVVLNSLGKLDLAIESYQHAIALRPRYTDAHSNLANLFVSQRKYTDALPHFQQVLAVNPDHADTHTNLGVALAEQGNFVEAITHYQRAIVLKPKGAEAFSNLGNALQAQGKLTDAIDCYNRALSFKPKYLTALYNLGNVYQALDKLGDAHQCYDRALAFQPDDSFALYGKALAQLLEGDFANGWQNYETRWRTVAQKPLRQYPQQRWNGDRASGSVFIWNEQGIGDEIMFAGLIPDVLRTGVHCILDCDPRLKPLIARSFPEVKLVSGGKQELTFSAHQPMGSLPGLFRRNLAEFANTKSPYLLADPEKRHQFRSRYKNGKLSVGLAWHTSNLNTGPSRCIDLDLFAPFFNDNDVSWISLQYGNNDNLEKSVARTPILIDRSVDQFADMDTFAAQIAALDLVITIDNSTAHLAAALGKPVWLLLPFARDWRWMQTRTDSLWYPTVRLFRQPINGDWQSVIQAVSKAIAEELPSRLSDSTD